MPVLPLVQDPSNIPSDIWDMWFNDREQLRRPEHITWLSTIGEALSSQHLPSDVVERIKTSENDYRAAQFVLENPHHSDLVKPLLQKFWRPEGHNPDLDDTVEWILSQKQPNLSEDTMQWIDDTFKGHRTNLLLSSGRNTPPGILHKIATASSSPAVYENLSKNPNLGHASKIELMTRTNVDPASWRKIVADSKPEDIDHAFTSSDSKGLDPRRFLRAMMASGFTNKLPKEAVDRLVYNPANHELFADGDVSENLPMSPDQAKALHDSRTHNSEYVRAWLARAVHTPESMLHTIANDFTSQQPAAQAAAATRIGPEVATNLWNAVKDRDDGWKYLSPFSNWKNNTPSSVLADLAIIDADQYAASGEHSSSENACRHPNLSADDSLRVLQHYTDPADPYLSKIKTNINGQFTAASTLTRDMFEFGKNLDHRHVQQVMDTMPLIQNHAFAIDPHKLAALSTPEQFAKMKDLVGPTWAPTLHDIGEETGKVPTTDPRVQVKFNTNRLRHARSLIDTAGGTMHESQLMQQGHDLRRQGYSKLIDPKGNVSSQAISRHIDSLPSMEYGVTEGEWGPNQMQMHDKSRQQNVFQLNATEKHLQDLSKAGLLSTYKSMLSSVAGSHPLHDTRGLGWVRYNVGQDGKIHMDEVQSDFHEGSPIFKLLKKRNDTQGISEFKQIQKILWGNKNPTDVIHEAFHQHMRDQSRTGVEAHIWHIEPKQKHHELGMLKPNLPPPVHHVNTYKNFPEKIGYEPGAYGESDAQSNPKYTGEKTLKTTIHKSEDIEVWLGLNVATLQKSLPANEEARQAIYRWELPVKVMLGDTFDYPEFRAAQMLAPNRRFNEEKYRESLRLYGDDMVMAAIFAYDLPRTQEVVRHVQQLMELYQ